VRGEDELDEGSQTAREKEKRQTVELGVVVDGSADADEDGVVEGADVVGDEHGVCAAERQLLAVGAGNLCIEGLGKGEADMRTRRRRWLLQMREGGGEEMHGKGT